MGIEKLAAEATKDITQLAAGTIKDIWSVMDAAAEKPAPSQYLGAKGMRAIQGVTDQAQKIAGAVTQAAN